MPDGNANQKLLDDTIRRRIALERYSNAEVRRALAFLKELERDIIARMATVSGYGRRQLAGLLKDVREIHADAYAKLTGDLDKAFRTLAGEEAKWQAGSLGGVGIEGRIAQLSTTAAFEAALARPMQGALLKDWMRDLEPRARQRLERALTVSFTEGENLSNAMKRVRDVIGGNRRGAQALIRTANSHIANAVQQATFEENADVIEMVEWRSVLDSRTTHICAARDGERYPVDSGPRPPAHVNCRSIIVAVVKGAPKAQRETYSEWIGRQGADVQDDILGPSRGKLLRSGQFKVTDFVDAKGKTLTLEELGQ